MPKEGTTEEKDETTNEEVPPTDSSKMSKEEIKKLKDNIKAQKEKTMNDVKSIIANNDSYIASGTEQLAYTDNPLSTAPVYETLPAQEISYLPISETNNVVSVYKEYADING
jgi:hypothetical protein